MKNPVVHSADILLPAQGTAFEKWSVIAVDQFTSEPEYWHKVEETVGDVPSALNLVLPEVYLKESETRIPQMLGNMRAYLENGVLETAVQDGFLLVERETSTGKRLGLMACIDLETYDFSKGSQSLVRATEETVAERVPPRVKIRRGAPVELPHALMLIDDPAQTVIEPLYAARDKLQTAYDFDLMMNGGHLRGWKVEGDFVKAVGDALDALYAQCGGLLVAVGDGNHSLAAARAYWLEIRENIPEAKREDHPARYALVEIENLRSPAICFEPIHRLMINVNPTAVLEALQAETGAKANGGTKVVSKGLEASFAIPLRELQAFLDAYLKSHPEAEIDYIHGDETLRTLAERPDALGFMPEPFDKAELFPYIREYGVLPRKTFSMGHANEKRYYTEARKI